MCDVKSGDAEAAGEPGQTVVVALTEGPDPPRRVPAVELEEDHCTLGGHRGHGDDEGAVALEPDGQAGDLGEGAVVDARAHGDGGDRGRDGGKVNLEFLDRSGGHDGPIAGAGREPSKSTPTNELVQRLRRIHYPVSLTQICVVLCDDVLRVGGPVVAR